MPALFMPFMWILAEIALFVIVGSEIGVGYLLLWILLSAMLGVAVISSQGRQMLENARDTFQNRREPLAETMNGMLVILGGALLVLPGLLTDMIGLAIILPGLGGLFRGRLEGWLRGRSTVAGAPYPPHGSADHHGPGAGAYQERAFDHGHFHDPGPAGFADRPHHAGPVIEGEFSVEDDDKRNGPAAG